MFWRRKRTEREAADLEREITQLRQLCDTKDEIILMYKDMLTQAHNKLDTVDFCYLDDLKRVQDNIEMLSSSRTKR